MNRNIEYLAQYWHLTRQTTRGKVMRYRSQLRAFRVGRRWLVPDDALREFTASGGAPGVKS
jgi:hypothetical protein